MLFYDSYSYYGIVILKVNEILRDRWRILRDRHGLTNILKNLTMSIPNLETWRTGPWQTHTHILNIHCLSHTINEKHRTHWHGYMFLSTWLTMQTNYKWNNKLHRHTFICCFVRWSRNFIRNAWSALIANKVCGYLMYTLFLSWSIANLIANYSCPLVAEQCHGWGINFEKSLLMTW